MIDRYATAEGRDALVNAYLSGAITPKAATGEIPVAAIERLEAKAAAKIETMAERWLSGTEPPYLEGERLRSRDGIREGVVTSCAIDPMMPSGWAVQAHAVGSEGEAGTSCAWTLKPVMAQRTKEGEYPTMDDSAPITEDEALAIAASVEPAEDSPWDLAAPDEVTNAVAELAEEHLESPAGRKVAGDLHAASIERKKFLDGYYEQDHDDESTDDDDDDDAPPSPVVEDVIHREFGVPGPRVMRRLDVIQAMVCDIDVAPLSDEEEAQRPRTRGDCRTGPRPCPWVACKYNLYLDVKGEALTLTWPSKEPGSLLESCALDIADRGEHLRPSVGAAMNMSAQGARSIEQIGLGRLWTSGNAKKLAEHSLQSLGDQPIALTSKSISPARAKIFTKHVDMSETDRSKLRDAPARIVPTR